MNTMHWDTHTEKHKTTLATAKYKQAFILHPSMFPPTQSLISKQRIARVNGEINTFLKAAITQNKVSSIASQHIKMLQWKMIWKSQELHFSV